MDVTEFRKAYIEASRHLVERFRNIRVHGKINAHDGQGEVELVALDGTVMRITTAVGDSLVSQTSRLPKRKSAVVRIGSDYWFSLTRRRADESYHIADVKSLQEMAKRDREILAGKRELWVEQFFKAPFYLYGKPIREWLVEGTGFRMESAVRSVNASGETIVEVRFVLTLNGRKSDFGRLVFLPNSSWVLRESEVRVTVTNDERTIRAAEGVRLSYASPRAQRQHYPDHVEIYQTDLATGKGNIQSLTVSAVEYGTVKQEDLTLAAFGLPDVTKREPTANPVPWWLWAAVAGIGLLVLAVAFHSLRRRRSMRR